MISQTAVYYKLASGTEIVKLSRRRLLLVSGSSRVIFEGASVELVGERLLPLLDGECEAHDIFSNLAQSDRAEVERHLNRLVDANVVVLETREASEPPLAASLLSFLRLAKIDPKQAREALSKACVAIFGLEGHGAWLAHTLAQSGIKTLILADPYPYEPANSCMMYPIGAEFMHRPRHEAVKSALARDFDLDARVIGDGKLTSTDVEQAAKSADFLVSCFDRGFKSTHHWINRAALKRGIPAIFSEFMAESAIAGPLILPGETACYMCYRMRAIACSNDPLEAMALEEHLDRTRQPRLHERPVLPGMTHLLAATLNMEILKCILGFQPLRLAGKIMTTNILTLASEFHSILEQPACPECKKKVLQPDPPDFGTILEQTARSGNILEATADLLSDRTGIVVGSARVQKDNAEPQKPFVVISVLSNSSFSQRRGETTACSGKGMTIEAAIASAMGEALENYSAIPWDQDRIAYGTRDSQSGHSLDPRSLVLYGDDQYDELEYSRYIDSTRLGWVRARSLTSGKLVAVPAVAAFFEYSTAVGEDLFPRSSNGLAVGETLLDAVLRGAFEVIERDAFLIAWLNQLPCSTVDPFSHPHSDIRGFCCAARRRGVEIYLCKLPVEIPVHVFLSIGVQIEGTGPAAVVGLGAELDPATAARSAILEVGQARAILRRELRDKRYLRRLRHLIADPARVKTTSDHPLLYCSREMLPAFGFLLNDHSGSWDWKDAAKISAAEKLRALIENLQAAKAELLYVDLTPPDLRKLNLYCARAIIPGYQPLHFGARECRLGGTRLFELPVALGLSSKIPSRDTLNPFPHPLG